MRRMEIGSQEWAVGIFCTVMGSMMLVAPHQFSSVAYAALQPHLPLWGAAFVVAGANLLAVATLQLRGQVATVGHLLAGAGLLVLAWGLLSVNSPTGALNYGAMGLGTVVAPLVASRARARRTEVEGDFLALSASAGAALTGFTMLAFPDIYSGPVNVAIRPHTLWLGTAFLGSGAFLGYVQLRSAAPWARRVAAHLLLGGTFIAFVLVSSLPIRAWLGAAYYGGFGVTIAAQPWLGPRLRAIDPASLRTRLALVLACATALPLIVLVALYGAREEEAAVSQGLVQNRTLALALAENVADYVGLHRITVAALATQPELLGMPPEAQRALLGTLLRTHPQARALLTFDAGGRPIARSDDLALVDSSGFPAFDEVRQTGRPSLGIFVSPVIHRPILALGEPILDPTGKLAGVAGVTFEPSRLADLLGRIATAGGGRPYLTDERGQVIAHQDSSLVSSRADLSSSPPLALALALGAGEASGSLEHSSPAGPQLAAYARVQESGWWVVVESPRADALAASRDRRDLALVLLLAVVALGAAAGVVVARLLASPLGTLVEAAEGLASGDLSAPLPRSTFSEAARLAAAFGDMREKLAARTEERERAERQLRELNASLEERVRRRTADLEASNKELEAFSYSVSHDLRAPLRAIDGFSRILSQEHSQQLSEGAQRYLGLVRANTQQMGHLIDDLLTFSRLSRQELSQRPVSPTELVHQALSELRQEQEGRRVEISLGNLATCRGDPSLLRQVFVNLLANALKFTRRREVAEIQVGCREEKGQNVYFVKDNGVGFDMRYAHKLFGVFQRLHRAEEYEGTGVGLAIVQRIVHRHGGRVWAEGAVGQGATFYFELKGDSSSGS